VPLILAFCLIVGLRVAFEIPVELRSNWVFRLMLDSDRHECEPLARKVILLLILPWAVLFVLPVYTYAAGLIIGALHALLVITWSFLLTEAVLTRFRKLPFTCSFPLFRQHSILIVVLCGMGYVGFAIMTSEVEHWALADPLRMIVFVLPAAAAWYALRRVRKNTMAIEKMLIFEEVPTRTVEVLQLTD
jgi:hypothetical protein